MTEVTRGGRVEFRFYRPEALRAAVAGDFNGWRGEMLPMQYDGEGWWVATMTLPPGEYRFRYLVDGRWFTDFAANGVESVEHGYNAVLFVPRSEPARLRPSPPAPF